jgi:effector-binding domain-containing protein
MTLTQDQIEELKKCINSALYNIYFSQDILLIESEANELTISFRFGLYFSDVIKGTSFSKDDQLSIDAEYNRNGEASKKMQLMGLKRRIKPDFILHHRGYNDKNVLVIEFKGHWNKDDRNKDINKLIGFTNPKENDYQYGLGAFIELMPKREECQITYFINGQPQPK